MDILVPGDTICVIGTTSRSAIPYDQIDNMIVTPEEVDILFERKNLHRVYVILEYFRAYAGVRPLVASDDDPSGRNVSRGIVLLDHASRDGLEGFVALLRGKLMTYRFDGRNGQLI